jgi:multiple sugar transport system substrate-binding protein
MSNEIFAWTASSNNTGMIAGRLSLAMNAVSITRALELSNKDLGNKINLLPVPKGPHGRLGLEHVMHTYMIWKFAKNKSAAKKFLADLEITYKGAFLNSKYYNFPSYPSAVKNIRHELATDRWAAAKPANKYVILDTIARKYTYNLGYPGNTNAAIGEMFDKWLIPQMFAEVAQGKRSPADAARTYDGQIRQIFQAWRDRKKI